MANDATRTMARYSPDCYGEANIRGSLNYWEITEPRQDRATDWILRNLKHKLKTPFCNTMAFMSIGTKCFLLSRPKFFPLSE